MEKFIKDFKKDIEEKEETIALAMAAVLGEIAMDDTDLKWAQPVASALTDYYYLVDNIKSMKDTDTL